MTRKNAKPICRAMRRAISREGADTVVMREGRTAPALYSLTSQVISVVPRQESHQDTGRVRIDPVDRGFFGPAGGYLDVRDIL